MKRNMTRALPIIAVCAALLTAFDCGGTQESRQAVQSGPRKIGVRGIVHKGVKTVEAPVTPSPGEQEKKEVAERLDTAGLMYTGKVVVDRDGKMLQPPETVAGFAGKEYIIAGEPPEIEFAVIPAEPLFLGESPVKSKSKIPNKPGPWSNWSQAAFDSRTGKFYSSIGDHGKYDAHIFLVEYDPAAKKVACLPEVNKVLGRKKTEFAEGKIHGWLDFYQSRDLDKRHLWYCTYWAKYPEPDEEDYATGYDGGHIMSYDVLTGDIVDYGVPLVRASWPYHRVDKKRGIMYAVGMFGEFLAWDINEQKTRWAGYLPDGMGWWERAILIDEETGMVYTTNRDRADSERHFIKYDPFKNRFFKLDCHMPEESATSTRGEKKGGYSHMRCQTAHRGPDGLYWGVSYGGEMFTFDPVKEEVAGKGTCWVGVQRYTTSIARNPGGRYLYYFPGAHGHGYSDGSPLVQYDTETGVKKVLAFMFPYYYDKYGYTCGGTFSIKLDDAGERLFICWNGAFIEHEEGRGGDTFGQCSVMVVNIPESERME
ncbi:MAG: hypothetical protein J7M24_00395 [Candidatus Latescibacteria bacterium]|nr:hypothetical protein [Candidatus Latescibacterota bacterium]